MKKMAKEKMYEGDAVKEKNVGRRRCERKNVRRRCDEKKYRGKR
jgi:hypothetical protein